MESWRLPITYKHMNSKNKIRKTSKSEKNLSVNMLLININICVNISISINMKVFLVNLEILDRREK